MDLSVLPGKKFSRFVVQHERRRSYKLWEPLLYIDKEFGSLVVPKEFDTDFASIDALRPHGAIGLVNLIMGYFSGFFLWLLYLLLIGYGDRAATIHDYLYRKSCSYKVSRKAADRVFYNALREDGVARWRAWIYYGGVRLFGFYAYKRK